MIAYFDTSALVKRYLVEEGTEQIAALWSDAQFRAVSRLAYAETLSALHRKEREQPSDQAELREVRARFERDWRTLLIVEISSQLDPWVRRLLNQYPLKGADVVHLASCLLYRESFGRSADICMLGPTSAARRSERGSGNGAGRACLRG
jgi:predicted nucleic acid-binding protein